MSTFTTICYGIAIIGGIACFYLDHKLAKRRRDREQRFIEWMNGRGPYPED